MLSKSSTSSLSPSSDFDDESFDAVGIAFAFRNLTWKNPVRDRALSEVLRVLREPVPLPLWDPMGSVAR